jgi:hypothetical protein
MAWCQVHCGTWPCSGLFCAKNLCALARFGATGFGLESGTLGTDLEPMSAGVSLQGGYTDVDFEARPTWVGQGCGAMATCLDSGYTEVVLETVSMRAIIALYSTRTGPHSGSGSVWSCWDLPGTEDS